MILCSLRKVHGHCYHICVLSGLGLLSPTMEKTTKGVEWTQGWRTMRLSDVVRWKADANSFWKRSHCPEEMRNSVRFVFKGKCYSLCMKHATKAMLPTFLLSQLNILSMRIFLELHYSRRGEIVKFSNASRDWFPKLLPRTIAFFILLKSWLASKIYTTEGHHASHV